MLVAALAAAMPPRTSRLPIDPAMCSRPNSRPSARLARALNHSRAEGATRKAQAASCKTLPPCAIITACPARIEIYEKLRAYGSLGSGVHATYPADERKVLGRLYRYGMTPGPASCAYRKLDPNILMMESAENGT